MEGVLPVLNESMRLNRLVSVSIAHTMDVSTEQVTAWMLINLLATWMLINPSVLTLDGGTSSVLIAHTTNTSL